MRDKADCRSKRDRAGKGDPRAPIVYSKAGLANAVIPANHKLMLLCTRLATHPSQYITRGKYVLFKFYVDGEALSEGVLHSYTRLPSANLTFILGRLSLILMR